MPEPTGKEILFNLSREVVCYERLNRWKLTYRQRLVAYWIVHLSFGKGRGFAWLTGRLLAEFTGLHEPDVSDRLGELQKMGVLQIHGPKNRPRRFKFLPDAEIVAPTPAVEKSKMDAAFEKFAALNIGYLEDEEVIRCRAAGMNPGQQTLDLADWEERLARDQAQASAGSAISGPDSERPSSVRSLLAEAREILEGTLRRGLGWDDEQIKSTRIVAVERLLDGAKSMAPAECQADLERVSVLLDAAAKALNQSSGKPLNRVSKTLNQSREPLNRLHAQAPARADSQLTGDSRDKSLQLPVNDSHDSGEISDSLNRPINPKIANPDLMRELREIIGEKLWNEKVWCSRRKKMVGNFGALWNIALRSSPVAAVACSRGIAAYRDGLQREPIHDPGGYIFGAFKRIHRSLRANPPQPQVTHETTHNHAAEIGA